MAETITADFLTLMNQAPPSIGFYMREAIKEMEYSFGPDAVERYPQVLAAMIQACAVEMQGATIAQQIRAGCVDICNSLDMLSVRVMTE